MSILGLLSAGATRPYSVPLARVIGVNAAIVLQELIRWHEYYTERDELDAAGMFYVTGDKMTDSTALTEREQSTALKHLAGFGLINQEAKGMPRKRYFFINEEVITELVMEQLAKEKATREARRQVTNNQSQVNEKAAETAPLSVSQKRETSFTDPQNKFHNSANNTKELNHLELSSLDQEQERKKVTPKKNITLARETYDELIDRKIAMEFNNQNMQHGNVMVIAVLKSYLQMLKMKNLMPTNDQLDTRINHLADISGHNPFEAVKIVKQALTGGFESFVPLIYTPAERQELESMNDPHASQMLDKSYHGRGGSSGNRGPDKRYHTAGKFNGSHSGNNEPYKARGRNPFLNWLRDNPNGA